MIKIIIINIFGFISLSLGILILAWFTYNQINPTLAFQENDTSISRLLIPIGLVILGWKWIRFKGKGIEDTPPDFQCQELEDSKLIAQDKLKNFIKEVEHNVDEAYIKFPLEVSNESIEHVWAYTHNYKNGCFNVSISNETYDESIDISSRRDINQKLVEDWQIILPNGKIKGAYSLIALFKNLENNNKKLTPKMKNQKEAFLDA